MSSTLRFMEMSFPLSDWFSSFFSAKSYSQEVGYNLVRLNSLMDGSCAITLRLLFFLMAVNFSAGGAGLNLFRQYFLSYLLWFVEVVNSLRFLASLGCLMKSRSIGW